MPFKNRQHAGLQLAAEIKKLSFQSAPIVFGLPRGGVPVAYEVARALSARLEVIICRKIGAPFNPEYAIGAISENGGIFLDQNAISESNISQNYLNTIIVQEQNKINEYQKIFRNNKPLTSLAGKDVILIDDGAATGMTMLAAIDTARKNNASRVIVGVPVAPPETAEKLKTAADEVVILEIPADFHAVAQFYDEFPQVETSAVKKMMDKKYIL